MKPTLVVAGAFVLLILGVSVLDFVRKRSIAASVQCLGAAFLIVVVFAHIAEALSLFPSMGWGLPHSMGHYIDLTSAICGLLFLSAGYLLRRGRLSGFMPADRLSLVAWPTSRKAAYELDAFKPNLELANTAKQNTIPRKRKS